MFNQPNTVRIYHSNSTHPRNLVYQFLSLLTRVYVLVSFEIYLNNNKCSEVCGVVDRMDGTKLDPLFG